MQQEKPTPFLIDDEQVIQALQELENETYNSTGIRYSSGGFASADIFDFDEDYFDVQLKWGVQNDCENTVHTENYTMDRLTLILKD